ncbi:uncharacterized protein LOC117211917 [Bombus bifarius]|uniref:Uncharacterized protein LOC117211917 n=1 Tax=Bombus bifarius TaxID=103933 RepID=A0A6P8NCC9_9HYME|nr:uncharacterized protein LOC117166650 [Bombus vancouverensis nearcticus]XP_033312140.1 uncharacterized protein LOC117211917 [Bombus bifarius]
MASTKRRQRGLKSRGMARTCVHTRCRAGFRTDKPICVGAPRGSPDLQPSNQLDIYFNEVRQMSGSCPGEQICRDTRDDSTTDDEEPTNEEEGNRTVESLWKR